MKWTAYYTYRDSSTNEVERVDFGKTFKTKRELVHSLVDCGILRFYGDYKRQVRLNSDSMLYIVNE